MPDHCPTCGSPVEVVSGDEGTHHYRPTRVAGLSSEDRARVEELRDDLAGQGSSPNRGPCELDAAKDAAALTRVLALIDRPAAEDERYGPTVAAEREQMQAVIDRQAEALEAADELARVVRRIEENRYFDSLPPSAVEAARAYRSTRTERTTDG